MFSYDKLLLPYRQIKADSVIADLSLRDERKRFSASTSEKGSRGEVGSKRPKPGQAANQLELEVTCRFSHEAVST